MTFLNKAPISNRKNGVGFAISTEVDVYTQFFSTKEELTDAISVLQEYEYVLRTEYVHGYQFLERRNGRISRESIIYTNTPDAEALYEGLLKFAGVHTSSLNDSAALTITKNINAF